MLLFGYLYSALVFLLSILVVPFFLFHSRGKLRLMERYGRWNSKFTHNDRPWIWFHGASNGEVLGLLPIIEETRLRHPSIAILLTSTSPTGLDAAQDIVEERHLLPFDSLLYLSFALRKYSFRCFIGAETEIWPSLMLYLGRRNIPAYLVNARISDRSYPRYLFLRWILAPIFSSFEKILTGDRISEQRFQNLGAKIVRYIGNAKYDRAPSISDAEMERDLRKKLTDDDRLIITLGSLRPGEESYWLPVMKKWQTSILFLLVPRHQEQFEFFASKLREATLSFTRWSQLEHKDSSNISVILVDAFGQLESLYSISQLAFIGGSLVDVGGHNPLEAAVYGVPIAMGSYYQNQREVVQDLIEVEGITILTSGGDVEDLMKRLIEQPTILKAKGMRAQEIWRSHRGAAKRIVEEILS